MSAQKKKCNETLIIFIFIFIFIIFIGYQYITMCEQPIDKAVVRFASASAPELKAWLNYSFKEGKGAALHEADTNGDGMVDENDMPNSALYNAVCRTYTETFSEIINPWDKTRPLVVHNTTGDTKMSVNCVQTEPDCLTLTAWDKKKIIYQKTICADARPEAR